MSSTARRLIFRTRGSIDAVRRALLGFEHELQSDFGVRVNQLLTDKGTEMAYDAMLNMDFPRITHMQSPTGNAVLFIEAKVSGDKLKPGMVAVGDAKGRPGR